MRVDIRTPGEQGPRHPHPDLRVPALLRHHHQGQGGGQVHGPRRRQGIAHEIFFFGLKRYVEVVLPEEPRLRATFPKNALYKKIKVGLQVQAIRPELVTAAFGRSVEVGG